MKESVAVDSVAERGIFPSSDFEDFPDRVPAVLVKEMRQGFRRKRIVASFLMVHAIAIFGLYTDFFSGDVTTFPSPLFVALAVIFFGVLPLTAFGGFNADLENGKIELLRMTPLTPWQMTFGKWTTFAAHILLCAVSVMPYILVRYTLGGLEMPIVAMSCGGGLAFSLVLSAIVLGTTTSRNAVVAIILLGAHVLMMWICIAVCVRGSFSPGGGGRLWILSCLIPIFFIYGTLGLASARSKLRLYDTMAEPPNGLGMAILGFVAMIAICMFGGMGGAIGGFVGGVMASLLVWAGCREVLPNTPTLLNS